MTVADITPDRWRAPGLKALEQLHATRPVGPLREGISPQGRLARPGRGGASTSTATSTGRIRGYFSFVTDASERKQAERALRESEEQFRRLYDEAPFGYHEIDLEGRIVNINRTECEMLGYSREEMLGRPIVDFVAEDQREAARIAVREKLRGERPLVPIERPYLARDGRRLIVGHRGAVPARRRGPDRRHPEHDPGRHRAEADRGGAGRLGAAGPGPLRGDRGRRLRPRPRRPDPRRQPRGLPAAGLHPRGVPPAHDQRPRRPRVRRRLRGPAPAARSSGGTSPSRGGTGPRTARSIPVDISTSMIQLEDQVAVLAVCRDITERKALEEARRQFAEAESRNAREIEAKNRDLSRSEARYRRLDRGGHDASSSPTARGGSPCSTRPPSGPSATRPTR